MLLAVKIQVGIVVFMRNFFFALVISLAAASCGKQAEPARQKPLVWVSIAPYQGIVQRLAGKDVEVEAIVPQNTNPHNFEPTSRQVAHMNQGLAWFCIGEPFEKKLLPLLQSSRSDLTVLDLRDKIHLIAEEGLSCSHCSMDHQDRHIWMSPKDTEIQAAEIARVLTEVFPEKKEEIASNLALLESELQNLDRQIRSILDTSKHRTILVSHPAFGYFCKDYGCRQLSVEYEGKDPRPKHIEEILARALADHTEIAIVLPQYNNKGAQLIAEKLHIPVRMIDPYSPDYFNTLLEMARAVANLKEEPAS